MVKIMSHKLSLLLLLGLPLLMSSIIFCFTLHQSKVVVAAVTLATPQIVNLPMTRSGNVTTFFNEGIYNGAVIDSVNKKGYFATFTNPGIIVRIDRSTMAREAKIAVPIG